MKLKWHFILEQGSSHRKVTEKAVLYLQRIQNGHKADYYISETKNSACVTSWKQRRNCKLPSSFLFLSVLKRENAHDKSLFWQRAWILSDKRWLWEETISKCWWLFPVSVIILLAVIRFYYFSCNLIDQDYRFSNYSSWFSLRIYYTSGWAAGVLAMADVDRNNIWITKHEWDG